MGRAGGSRRQVWAGQSEPSRTQAPDSGPESSSQRSLSHLSQEKNAHRTARALGIGTPEGWAEGGPFSFQSPAWLPELRVNLLFLLLLLLGLMAGISVRGPRLLAQGNRGRGAALEAQGLGVPE